MPINNATSNTRVSSSVGVPYSEENSQIEETELKEKGRVILQLAVDEQYRDDYEIESKRCIPHDRELAVDKEGNLGIWIRTEGQWKFESVTKRLSDIILQLEDLGVLQNARAFAANSSINNMMFDNERKQVVLNPDKLYRRDIRYYAIRSSEMNDNGEYEWMTGIISKDQYGRQELKTQFIDMIEVKREIGGEVVILSQPKNGSLIRDMVDGESYAVVFADADKRICGVDIYDAISVTSQAGIIAPNTAISGLIIQSSRIGPDDESTYLYVGESIANLALRVFLKYADNSTYEITPEQVSNGRLVIEGLDNISTEIPTDDTHLPYDITVKYYFLDTNAENSEGKQEDGSEISNESNFISKNYKVHVKENIYDDVVKIIPTGYINGEPNLPETKVRLKLFGLYQSGARRDITPLTKSNDRLIGYDNAMYNDAKDTWDAANSIINTGSNNIIVKIPQGKTGAIKQFDFTMETSTAHRRFIINGENSKFINFNAYTGKMSFEETVSSPALITANEFTNKDGSKVSPTHFSIRSAMEPEALFVDKVSLDNIRNFAYDTAIGLQPFTDMPLIIEFSKIIEGGEGVTNSVFITNVALYYAKQAN